MYKAALFTKSGELGKGEETEQIMVLYNRTLLNKKEKKRRYNKTLWIASSILSFWYLLKRNQPKEAFPGYPNLMSLLPITLQHLTFCYDLKIHHYMNYLFGLCCITPLKCKLHEGKEPCLVQPTECLQWKRNSNIYPINEWTTCNKSDRS